MLAGVKSGVTRMLRGLVRVLERRETVWAAGAVGVSAGLVALVTVAGGWGGWNVGPRAALGQGPAGTSTSGTSTNAAAAMRTSAGPKTVEPAGAGRSTAPVPTGPTGPVRGPTQGPARGPIAPSPAVGAAATPTSAAGGDIRVRVLAGVNGVEIASASGLMVAHSGGAGVTRVEPRVTVVLDAYGWLVAGRAGAAGQEAAGGAEGDHGLRYPGGGAVTLTPVRVQDGITVNGSLLPGRVRLAARSDMGLSTFDVIEIVPVEDYLPGVVAKEMFPGWPLEAYKVQAVCARSYAVQERDRSVAKGQAFDVEAGEMDQAYLGVTSNAAAIEAVRATRGEVLTFNGRVLRAYYSSTCGGRAASAKDTWPFGPGWEFNLDGPIQGAMREHACDDAPLYRWEVHRDRKETVARLRAFGQQRQFMIRQIRDIASVEMIESNGVGRPARFKIIEPGGRWFMLSGEELRLAFNTQVPGTEVIERRNRVSSSDIDVRVRGDEVVVVGRGFGHGVGMCQYCARGFAARGEDWRTMLRRFYPGATIEKRW